MGIFKYLTSSEGRVLGDSVCGESDWFPRCPYIHAAGTWALIRLSLSGTAVPLPQDIYGMYVAGATVR